MTSGLDVVSRYRELFADGRVGEALELVSQELEFVPPAGPALGYAEVKEMWSESEPGFDHLTLEVVATSLQEVGENRYLGESEHVFRWKETGEISNVERRAMLYTVEEGKIRRMRFFVKPDEAWAEVGVAKR